MSRLGGARGMVARIRQRIGAWQRGRLPLVVLVSACLVAATAAVSGAGTSSPGLRFAQIGHWIANPSLDTVFHVNGAAGTVDARARVDGMEPGSQVVQGETSGYVVGRGRIVEFGKSSLSVEQTLTPPTGERPVAIEAKGGPYLVYRAAGSVVRLGARPATIAAGSSLGDPVVTPDGVLWLHRTGGNVLCHLAPDAERVSCPVAAPAGHPGALTVVGGQAVFVDTEDDTLIPVSDAGVGEPVPTGVDLPATARVAAADVEGRLPVLDPGEHRLLLIGTGRTPGLPVTVDLPDGTYATPAAGRSSVVLLDLRRHEVRTYDSAGAPRQVTTVPPEDGEPRLSRGDDERVYVEGAEGRNVLIVDDQGRAVPVPLAGTGSPGTGRPSVGSSARPGTRPPQGSTAGPPAPRREPVGRTAGPTSPAAGTVPVPSPTLPPRAVPAGPPGMPPGLRAAVRGDDVILTWRAAAGNGATVTGHLITWTPAEGAGGSATRPGTARSMTLTGLTRGVPYRITVAAQNAAGRGTPATAVVTVPQPARTVTVARGRTTTADHGCDPPKCAFPRIELRHFPPGAAVKINPWASGWGRYNVGARLTTDENGYLLVDDRFPFSGVGQTIWVEVDGVESNRLLWTTG